MGKWGHTVNFSSLENSYKQLVTVLPDYIILFYASESGKNDPLLLKLKNISDELRIPLTLLETYDDAKYLMLQINRIITELITSPFGKNFFFKYIDGVIKKLATGEPVRLTADSSQIINSLFASLISQKRLDIPSVPETETESELLKSHTANQEKRNLETRLWAAFENKKFRLYYQPVMSLAHDRISGFEALIRLVDENDNIISPDNFIAVAEESALIYPLGLWIVEEACRQMQAWKARFHIDTSLRINVNISPRQFIFPDLAKSILEIIDKYDISSEDIGFEITESALMGDMESANLALLEFRSRNFMIYMDDFGTGYSSLSYLMHFPVNTIKIDQSFVKWMHIDDQSEILVKSIIALAHNLGLKVVAEGTDDESHIELLKLFGCDYAQGYYFAKPLPPDEAENFLEKYLKKTYTASNPLL